VTVQEAEGSSWSPVAGSLLIWAAIVVLNALTSFIERSPIHSDAWWPLLTVWGTALGVGVGLLVIRRRAWGAAWLVGGLGGAIAYVGAVIIFVVTQGH
jgi:hypothetical protein